MERISKVIGNLNTGYRPNKGRHDADNKNGIDPDEGSFLNEAIPEDAYPFGARHHILQKQDERAENFEHKKRVERDKSGRRKLLPQRRRALAHHT
jgi:hypothetical protein